MDHSHQHDDGYGRRCALLDAQRRWVHLVPVPHNGFLHELRELHLRRIANLPQQCSDVVEGFDTDDGKVADYIPQLSKVDPNLFAISVCKVNGEVLNFGNFDTRFCLQSRASTFCACQLMNSCA